MSDAASDLIDRYVVAWNQTDAGHRRDLIAGVQATLPGRRFAHGQEGEIR